MLARGRRDEARAPGVRTVQPPQTDPQSKAVIFLLFLKVIWSVARGKRKGVPLIPPRAFFGKLFRHFCVKIADAHSPPQNRPPFFCRVRRLRGRKAALEIRATPPRIKPEPLPPAEPAAPYESP